MISIYAIKNLINNKVYVGSTKSLKKRKYRHFYELKINIHSNIHLQRSYNEHGKDKFSFFLLEECISTIRSEREIYWINYFNSHNKDYGFNIYEPNGDNFQCSKETKQKITNTLKDKGASKGVDVYTIDLEFLQTFNSINECARFFNIPMIVISNIINKKNNRLSYHKMTFFNEGETPYNRISTKQRNMTKYQKRYITNILKN